MTAYKTIASSVLMALLLTLTTAFAASAQENYPPGQAGTVDCSASQVGDGESTTCGTPAGTFMGDSPVEYEIVYGAQEGEDPGQAAGTFSFASASAQPTFRFAPTADQSHVQLAQAPYRRVETGTTTANADGSVSITVSPREGEVVESISFTGIDPEGNPVRYSADGEEVLPVVDDEQQQGGADGDADGDEDGLPATGSDFTVGAALAAIALVGGAALVLVGRKRSRDGIEA